MSPVPLRARPSRVSKSGTSQATLAFLALCRTPLVKTPHRGLFTALTQQGEPKNPECESVQDFYFLPLHSSLFTKIRTRDFLKVIGKR